MMESVVAYTLERCVKCMKCIQACPVSAVSMENNRIIVAHERCTNCGRCIDACHSQGLVAQGSTLVDIANYDYTVCLVPPALTSACRSKEEAEDLFNGIKLLGFDEVVDLSPYYGTVLRESLAYQTENRPAIVSMCSVVNRLIKTEYQVLIDHLIPMNYPAEIAARDLRMKLTDKGTVGIFNMCECASRLVHAKYPYGTLDSEIDHALSIADTFPLIRKNLGKGRQKLNLCRDGFAAMDTVMLGEHPRVLAADGYDKVQNILELAEFGRLKEFDVLYLLPCFNGCSGGQLLFGNGYLSHQNIPSLTEKETGCCQDVSQECIWRNSFMAEEDRRSFTEKMEFFRKVNEVLEKLPGYDCSACGMRTCRIMAEEIVSGNRSLSDCHILNSASREDVQ
ncbi:MAG: 4Fe-4S dicluster domain-containing protein [Solobacterium sp.]|nr:4Fe-4S dicluster domain-containing protein [Solobacterium sp.]